jgi:DNA-binding CsgD family transcriptional regulator
MNVIDNTTHLNNQQEEWRKVVGFERFYSVSSLGRVRSDIQRNHRPHGRILSQSLKKTGYLQICLSMNGKHFYYNVHTLVTEAFIGPRPADFQVNHLNGIKTDNRRENLEYVTRSENSQHALKLGLRKRGEAHVNAKLKESDVREILRLHSDGNNTLKEIGDMFDIQPTQVFKIVTGETWAHVGAEIGLMSQAERTKRHQLLTIKHTPKGGNVATSKLAEEQVKEIRHLLSEGRSVRECALDFNISEASIKAIRSGTVWSHVR